jgi:hypothetical protein
MTKHLAAMPGAFSFQSAEKSRDVGFCYRVAVDSGEAMRARRDSSQDPISAAPDTQTKPIMSQCVSERRLLFGNHCFAADAANSPRGSRLPQGVEKCACAAWF